MLLLDTPYHSLLVSVNRQCQCQQNRSLSITFEEKVLINLYAVRLGRCLDGSSPRGSHAWYGVCVYISYYMGRYLCCPEWPVDVLHG